MKRPPFPEMDELLQRLLDDQIQPDEMERLQQAIRGNPQVRDYYVDSMLACAVIRRSGQATGEFSASDLMQALSVSGNQGGFRRVLRYIASIAAILILGTLILTSLFFVRHWTRGSAIGTLAGTYEAQWRGAHPRPGEPLYARLYDLRQGAAQMELDPGTSLLLEAPCRIELFDANEMILRSGRLTVSVSPEATGFQVRTDAAVITDRGTEFGVFAHPDGGIEAHVLKGHIRVALHPDKAGQMTSLVVEEGQATSVDVGGRTLRDGLAARADLFLRQLPLPNRSHVSSDHVNLADIIGGGNGRGTGTLEQGIDLDSGQVFRQPSNEIKWARRNEFQPVTALRGIDGVFVPNRALGRVTVSSTGLLFSQCPETHGSYYGGPVNSGKFLDLLDKQVYTARLNGIPFGTSKHPALSLHPNAGITFDLDAIRLDHPDLRLERFTAICGIPKDLPRPRFSATDVWILLDGAVGLHRRYLLGPGAVEKIDIPIPVRTRFLTLAATCSGRADYSWIIFGDPFLGSSFDAQEEADP